MIGQTVVACSQMFVLSIPPRLAAVWFSPEEISRACAVGVFGNQVRALFFTNTSAYILLDPGWSS